MHQRKRRFHHGKRRSHKSDITPEHKKYAVFTNSAYSETQKPFPGYHLLPKVSDKYVSVYESPDEAIIAVRGTQLDDVNDISADVAIGLGSLKSTQRYKHAEDVLQRVVQHYNGDRPIVVAGHSLGGSIALTLKEEHGSIAKAYAYNAPSVPQNGPKPMIIGGYFSTLLHPAKTYHDPDSHSVYIRDDLISVSNALNPTAIGYDKQTPEFSAHSNNQFIQ